MSNTNPIVTAIVGNSADVMTHILALYVGPGSSIADVTYKDGAFWRKTDLANYTLIPSDLNPVTTETAHMDLRQTVYEPCSLDCFVLDPPFANGSTTPRKSPVSKRYNLQSCLTPEAVLDLYAAGILEARRTLRPRGILVAKCQDMVNSGKQNRMSIKVWNLATTLGFEDVDRFTLVSPNAPLMRWEHQVHARKNESYFWVFRKR